MNVAVCTLPRFVTARTGHFSFVNLNRRLLLSAVRTKVCFHVRTFTTTILKMSGEDDAKKAFKRLPTSVVPSNYQITLQPNLQDFKFKGSQIVELDVSDFYQFWMLVKRK